MPLGQLDGGHILHALIGRRQLYFGWAAFIILMLLSMSWPGWGVWILMVLLFLRVGHPVLGDMTPLGIRERVIGWSCMVILLLTFVPAPVDILENDTIFPIECAKCAAPLEPSGLALMNGRLLMVSDSECGVFELAKGERGYRALPWMRPRLTGRAVHGCDFEGLALHENLFYITDERNRRVLVSDATGRTEILPHDIADYNRRHGIAFSREPNAGFEGIAVDPARGTVFLLNEREPAVIYRLEKENGALKTVLHLRLASHKAPEISDASDLFFDRGFLYVLRAARTGSSSSTREAGKSRGSWTIRGPRRGCTCRTGGTGLPRGSAWTTGGYISCSTATARPCAAPGKAGTGHL